MRQEWGKLSSKRVKKGEIEEKKGAKHITIFFFQLTHFHITMESFHEEAITQTEFKDRILALQEMQTAWPNMTPEDVDYFNSNLIQRL